MDDQNKNLILASVLSFLVILVWYTFVSPPEAPEAQAPGIEASTPAEGLLPPPAAAAPDAAPQVAAPAASPAAAAGVASADRVQIDTPRLSGSISLAGGRIDDLLLLDYKETLDAGSPDVRLLAPVGAAADDHAYYAVYGWLPAGGMDPALVPDARTIWSVESGDVLAPGQPVTLQWDNGAGLIFHRQITVDDNYLFTVTQSVENRGTTPVRLAPYGIVARHGKPEGQSFYVLHEGAVGMADGELDELKYKNIAKLDPVPREGMAEIRDVTENGWIGFTDKYWMTTLVPEPGQPFTSVVKYAPAADIYQAEARLPVMDVMPGGTVGATTMLFAGAKEWQTIKDYETNLGIDRFIDSIDWGWFFPLTKGMFWILHHLNQLFAGYGLPGAMGWAIIGLTILIKLVVFPLAKTSYVSMAKMKEIQPEMEKLKERCGDDKQRLQMEMMALYKREKVNPAAGCLPIFLQIPIFFSLYKVIFVTIELRHAPWIGWIHDLSAPDPTSILNLFGLLNTPVPDPSSFLHIFSLGILPIILGISMWLQQKLNPTPTDPTQAAIFAWMPWVFMFMLGSFASGLVIYWIANNMITFIQQYTIMTMHGHRPDLFGNILASFSRKQAAAPANAPKPVSTKAAHKADTAKSGAATPAEGKPAARPSKSGRAGNSLRDKK
ncbi:membrane protein insertase YidC [Phaeovulum vinaykumarii]|uniref:Membrane protein insertase YidC n=1 Tax=Phaeovulum vinaykumarii TaxID=407234 RepID=A0A1N7LAJ7_9RHOB|nr:membrane protein insertase YidC [Phaeovulum vinaykumarii]SIS70858.1 protein translocase subunit yidC [Phaeovulum vinaykumarii]SOB98683.1 protein translocase subunit yidC [Phaeovulum vinaykumarii]